MRYGRITKKASLDLSDLKAKDVAHRSTTQADQLLERLARRAQPQQLREAFKTHLRGGAKPKAVAAGWKEVLQPLLDENVRVHNAYNRVCWTQAE